ncbi:Aspartate aminotransferase [Achromobacter mucicolens]|nr:hypothetical protein BMR85_003685 [Achromobacter sp. KAs 3-5]CAB3635308.1 Aspartate aminotransferase [Achromobacter mucicolens]
MEFLIPRNQAFQRRRDHGLDALNAIEGIHCRTPEGAFYLFPSCEGLIGRTTPQGRVLKSDVDVSQFFLDAAHVAVVPGSAFGAEGYFRISFATSDERLAQACKRLRDTCDTLD